MNNLVIGLSTRNTGIPQSKRTKLSLNSPAAVIVIVLQAVLVMKVWISMQNMMLQALDGGYITPRLKILKLYIQQDLEAKVLIQEKEFSQEKSQEKKASVEEES
ncbi:hypothetical protein O181_008809 [Austropuccinia psidii MF-1]|uniref:Uncharacterized protein n=1 Tax=Austropuccinia psidii MF-1 TaxID=1389203 RepID=A0A9Q3BN59_9BASI|nr:hypothetical protein [Austropuccinia psidii MF-1]